jgi:hypothetical protein
MSVSLKKHRVKGPVQLGRYFVMENARRGLYNVKENVWMHIISLLIVMERAQNINSQIGFAILPVSLVKNLAMENVLRVNLKTI